MSQSYTTASNMKNTLIDSQFINIIVKSDMNEDLTIKINNLFSIGILKSRINQVAKIKCDNFNIIYNDRNLEDKKTIKDANIIDGSTVRIVPCMVSGKKKDLNQTESKLENLIKNKLPQLKQIPIQSKQHNDSNKQNIKTKARELVSSGINGLAVVRTKSGEKKMILLDKEAMDIARSYQQTQVAKGKPGFNIVHDDKIVYNALMNASESINKASIPSIRKPVIERTISNQLITFTNDEPSELFSPYVKLKIIDNSSDYVYFSIKVHRRNCTGTVFGFISQKLNMTLDKFDLIYNDTVLKCDSTLIVDGIIKDETITLVVHNHIRISFINEIDNKETKIVFMRTSSLISAGIRFASQYFKINEDVILSHNGTSLDNNKTWKDYDIHNGAVIKVNIKCNSILIRKIMECLETMRLSSTYSVDKFEQTDSFNHFFDLTILKTINADTKKLFSIMDIEDAFEHQHQITMTCPPKTIEFIIHFINTAYNGEIPDVLSATIQNMIDDESDRHYYAYETDERINGLIDFFENVYDKAVLVRRVDRDIYVALMYGCYEHIYITPMIYWKTV